MKQGLRQGNHFDDLNFSRRGRAELIRPVRRAKDVFLGQ